MTSNYPNDFPPVPNRKVCLYDVIEEFAACTQAPRDLSLGTVLSAVATVCQGLIDVEYPFGDTMPTSLIVFSVAGSGEGKTPLQNMAFAAIKRFERFQQESVDVQAAQDFEAAFEIWEAKRKAYNVNISRLIRQGLDAAEAENVLLAHVKAQPQRPRGSQILYDDFTPAGLVAKLAEHWPYGCVNNTDAASALLGKSFEDPTLFNKLSDGDSIISDRASVASRVLRGGRLTLNIAVQPESFRKFLERRSGIARSSGFLPRALIAYPPSNVGYRNKLSSPIRLSLQLMVFEFRMTELLERLALAIADGNSNRTVMRLSVNGVLRWREYAQQCEHRCASGGMYAEIKDHASKMPGIVLRMAALLQYFETDATTIELPSLELAIRWGNFYLDSAREIYRSSYSDAEMAELCNKMLTWLYQFTGCAKPVRRGEIGAYCPAVFRGNKDLIEQTLNLLVGSGLVSKIEGARGDSYVPKLGGASWNGPPPLAM